MPLKSMLFYKHKFYTEYTYMNKEHEINNDKEMLYSNRIINKDITFIK